MIGVAVVGAGHWGPNLIANFERSGRSRVVAVVDRDEQRLSTVAARFPSIRTSSDFASILSDSSVEAVVIATPTRSHFELARAALAHGKHVLVEKPLTDSLATSRELCQLARQTDRVLMVGHVFVYNAAARRVKEYIAAGDLGRIYYISMVRTNLGPIRVDVDAAWDLAAHDIALASHWLDAEPATVSAAGGAFINRGIADVIFATLRYPADVLVNLHASWLNPRKARDITVVGDRRMLTFDDVDLAEPLRLYDKQVGDERSRPGFVDSFQSFRMSVHDGEISVPRVEPSEPLRNECEHFLDCVIEGKQPLSGAVQGLAVVRVLDALSHSLREGGREVAVEPE
jgi:predicted dehydrogenase